MWPWLICHALNHSFYSCSWFPAPHGSAKWLIIRIESNWSVLYIWEEMPVEHNATIIIKVAIVPSEVSHRLKYCLKEQLNPKEPTIQCSKCDWIRLLNESSFFFPQLCLLSVNITWIARLHYKKEFRLYFAQYTLQYWLRHESFFRNFML